MSVPSDNAAAISRVCVFCAASRRVDEGYFAQARTTGTMLAKAGLTTIYGGGNHGLMGALADAALAAGGRVVGVLPRFMDEVEWGHRKLTELRLVESMEQRLGTMLAESHAFITLPGGTGTLEELFFVLSRKRLGLTTAPVVIVNYRGYFEPTLESLRLCVREGFIDARHAEMWSVVSDAGEALEAIKRAPAWSESAKGFAVP
jgi:uncharacterized protein (TIGR00730 family)